MADKPEDKKGDGAGNPNEKPAADKSKGAAKKSGKTDKAAEASPTGAKSPAKSPAKPDSEKTPDTEAAKPVKEAAEKAGRPETVQEKPEPLAGAAVPAEKPAATLGPEATGTAAPPASAASAASAAKAGATADTTKPSVPAAAGAAKPAAPAPAAPEPPKEMGPFGNFLKDVGIASTRSFDSVGTSGMVETIEVDAKDLEQAMKRLRGTEMRMTYLLMVSGVETADTYDSVYHVWSYEDLTKELVVKVRVPKAGIPEGQLPVVPSITPFWQAANWHEREEYDLMGIKYFGHPYLRRLMNPWDWDGYPLRKDYKQPVDALNDKNPHSMR